MPDREVPPPDAPPADTLHPEGQADVTINPDGTPLDLAARAILGYLDDLAACRELCRHHEASVGMWPDPHALCVVAAAERMPEGDLAQVRAAADALPSAGRWRGRAVGDTCPSAGVRGQIARHVLWEQEPLYVRVVAQEFGLLRAELILPHRPDLSRLPLRAVASVLRCLEYLLPPTVARPVPLAELADGSLVGLWDLLRRATPENLPSGQCIWPGGAVQQPTLEDPITPPS